MKITTKNAMPSTKIRLPLAPVSLAVLAALAAPSLLAQTVSLGEVTVTGTREGQLVAETPATVGLIKESALREAKPTHPADVMGQVAGVWVNVTGGEGHQTAIRQPLTTSPVYLFLEDGIPTRSTGFFNHNALYEVNLPQAGGIEVSKGPGSALYGSDAIGGVVNVLTRTPPRKAEVEASIEAGGHGWRRGMLSGGNAFGDDAFRIDLNTTHSDGWREGTGYDRQAGTLRWDRAVGGDALLKTVLSFSTIDQQTAGSSGLSQADYEKNPRRNYAPISFRKVSALRLSSAYEKETADTLLSITPYFRNNDMDLLANWSLSYDPTVYNTRNQSFGVLLKYRMDFAPMRARLIVGTDIDYSPGSRSEDRINPSTTGSGYTRIYTGYTTGARVYDYDVSYRGVSPYIHGEISPVERLRLTAGLRYDSIRYDFSNNLAAAAIQAGSWYGQAGDSGISYSHLSPKLGATWAFSERLNGFASYNHAFRTPSEGQLFRPSAAGSEAAARLAAQSALTLKPVKVDSYEIGLRGLAGKRMNYEISLYHMSKRDDIVGYRDPVTNATTSLNAGRTEHQGVEIGAGVELAKLLRLDAAVSRARHIYKEWAVSGTADFSGKEMEMAPRSIGNVRLAYGNETQGRLLVEWVHLGSWWSNQANTVKYGGHELFNLRGQLRVARDVKLFANVHNLFDRRYAESAGVSSGFATFAPGLPRTLVAGVEAKW